MLYKVYDHEDHFSSKLVLDCLKFHVLWPKMAFDIHKYIQKCLSCAKWTIFA